MSNENLDETAPDEEEENSSDEVEDSEGDEEEDEEEDEDEEEEKKEKYISKYLSLKLVDKSSYSKEIEGRVVSVTGKSIRFENGIYETSDPDEISFLDNHPNNGTIFIKVKDKDLRKARSERFKDLETKEAEVKAKEKELAKREKALEEGEGLPKGNKNQESSKIENPKF